MSVQTLIVQIQLIQWGKALDALKLQEKLEGRDGNADPENAAQRKRGSRPSFVPMKKNTPVGTIEAIAHT